MCACGPATACSDDDPAPQEYPIVPSDPDDTDDPADPSEPVQLELRVDGRYLRDADGNIVNLHGFAQTYSPWFNEQMTQWNNYDVDACLRYNQNLVDRMLAVGWQFNFIRLHMDPYWSNTPGVRTEGEADISAFDMERFKKYLDEVFVPMAEYCIDRGLYVVMRPPGVCPHEIAVGDAYQAYLKKVWNHVSLHPRLRNNGRVMFELANEPVHILAGGRQGADTQAHFDELKKYFQPIVDIFRSNGAQNILWVPGLAYQGTYWGLASNPIEGDNIGYAVHCYPGWMGSDGENGDGGISDNGGYASFQAGWDAQVQPIADIAPVMVTEMDWAPAKYDDDSWGKALTGVAGGAGFGANFKYIADRCGNVSWLLFTSPDLLARFDPANPADSTNTCFLNDPEACPWPVYHWFRDYAQGTSQADRTPASIALAAATDGRLSLSLGSSVRLIVNATGADATRWVVTEGLTFDSSDPDVISVDDEGNLRALAEGTATLTITLATAATELSTTVGVTVTPVFPLTAGGVDPSIWETGVYDAETRTLATGKYGFGGWRFPSGVDLSAFSTLTVSIANTDNGNASFRLFDSNNYWSAPAQYDFGASTQVVIDLHDMRTADGVKVDPSHIFIAGFWSLGNDDVSQAITNRIVIKSVTLTR